MQGLWEALHGRDRQEGSGSSVVKKEESSNVGFFGRFRIDSQGENEELIILLLTLFQGFGCGDCSGESRDGEQRAMQAAIVDMKSGQEKFLNKIVFWSFRKS